MGLVLTLKTPLWITIVFVVIAFAVFYRLQEVRKKRYNSITAPVSINIATSAPRDEPVILPPPAAQDNLIFDSNLSDESYWKGYGQSLWDNDKKDFVGEAGKGDYHFRQHILTIARSNAAGRYIIEIKRYLTDPIDFVPQMGIPGMLTMRSGDADHPLSVGVVPAL
jgi:hypothetical protein